MPHRRRDYRELKITKAQTNFAIELLEDDLAETDLTHNERNCAQSLLDKLRVIQIEFGEDDG